MKHRSPIVVFLIPFVTFGIYSWYWLVSTKNDMNRMGEHIPTAWIWLIPMVGGIWWYWKYSEGVEHVTGEKLNKVGAFLLLFLLGHIGHAIIQDYFNNITAPAATTSAVTSQAPVTPPVQPAVTAPVNPSSTTPQEVNQ